MCKKHGKLVTFLRTFMKSRPPPQKLRQRGILKERVFGCDLGEHLHSSEHEGELDFHLSRCNLLTGIPITQKRSVSCWDASTLNIYRLFLYLLVFPLCSCVLAHHDSLHAVPQVVKSCTEFIEKNGVVDGIYRLSGISSNIQKLRCATNSSKASFQWHCCFSSAQL